MTRMRLKLFQVVVRVGLGAGRNSNAIGNNGGNSANNSALSVSPSMPAMASLESSPSGETSAKTIEQRRSEARERLFKDRSRKVRITPRSIKAPLSCQNGLSGFKATGQSKPH